MSYPTQTHDAHTTPTHTVAERLRAMRAALANHHDRGMSLVEVLIVLTNMASIAGVVGVFAVGALGDAQEREAKIEAGNLNSMVEQYMIMQSPPQLPNTLEDLTKGRNPVTKKVPNDPWGNPYIYRTSGSRDWTVFSTGADGQEGTEDDIYAEGEGPDNQ